LAEKDQRNENEAEAELRLRMRLLRDGWAVVIYCWEAV
jgi:hypothetical protein